MNRSLYFCIKRVYQCRSTMIAMAVNIQMRKRKMSVLKPEAMSSDKSGDDDGDEVILVYPLP